MAKFDNDGNVVTQDGKPWIGGNPFPEPTTGVEIFAGITLSWGRHDVSFYPVKSFELDVTGKVLYNYELAWCEFAPTGRIVVDPKPYWQTQQWAAMAMAVRGDVDGAIACIEALRGPYASDTALSAVAEKFLLDAGRIAWSGVPKDAPVVAGTDLEDA